MPGSNTLLALILIALGILGIILSFLVPDRKKSMIALVLGGIIVGTGTLQWCSQALSSFQLNRRMRQIQRERQVDLDALREKLKDQASKAPVPVSNSPKKP